MRSLDNVEAEMKNRKTSLEMIIGTAIVLLFIQAADAALVIDSFSCNSQSSTVNVENGANMNCNAVILNNDPSASVTVNSVSLVVSGSWAEESSYTVAINSAIGASQTKTVTFQNIKSVTPGNDNRFLHIDIDGNAHTEEVSSVSVNAVVIKVLSLSTSAGSVNSNTDFTATASATAGGSFTDVTVALGLSGCSLASGETASKSLGALNNNAQASISWTVTQGTSATCTLTATATGTASSVVVTKSKSATVSNPNPSVSSSGSSAAGGEGGGGGGGGANTYEKGELASAVSQSLASGDIVKFTLGGQSHQLKLVKITNTSAATFNLSSTTETFTLAVGEEKKKDFDGDGSFDLSVVLNSIKSSKADVTLTPLGKAAAPETGGQTPETSTKGPTGKETKEPAKGVEGPSGGDMLTFVTGGMNTVFVVALMVFVLAGAYLFWSRAKGKKAK